MKKLFITILTLGFTLFSSCDNNDETTEELEFTGTWNLTEYLIENGTKKSLFNDTGFVLNENFTTTGKDINLSVTFKDGPKTEFTHSRYSSPAVTTGSLTRVRTTTSITDSTEGYIEEEFNYIGLEISEYSISEYSLVGSPKSMLFVYRSPENGSFTSMSGVNVLEYSDKKMILSLGISERFFEKTEPSSIHISTQGTLKLTFER